MYVLIHLLTSSAPFVNLFNEVVLLSVKVWFHFLYWYQNSVLKALDYKFSLHCQCKISTTVYRQHLSLLLKLSSFVTLYWGNTVFIQQKRYKTCNHTSTRTHTVKVNDLIQISVRQHSVPTSGTLRCVKALHTRECKIPVHSWHSLVLLC